MKYLVTDGMLNGTGIRDKYDGGYLTQIARICNKYPCADTRSLGYAVIFLVNG